MEVHINNHQDKVTVSGLNKLVRKALGTALEALGSGGKVEVSLTYVDDAEIQELNHNYRHVQSATDVLSFPLEEGPEFAVVPDCPRLLGDIVISLERAVEQSQEYGHSLAREVCYLAVHGLLHLVGYDHQTETERQKMRLMEEQVMAEINLGRN